MAIRTLCMVCGATKWTVDCKADGISHGACDGECSRLFEEWVMTPESKLALADYAKLHRRDTMPSPANPEGGKTP